MTLINRSKFHVPIKDANRKQTKMLCFIIFIAGFVFCGEDNRCITADVKDKCPQLLDDEEIKKKQQDMIDNAAICAQKLITEAKVPKTEQCKIETPKQLTCDKVEVKKKKRQLIKKKVKKKYVPKKDKVKQKCTKKPKRSCAIQLRINRLKTQCTCGMSRVKPIEEQSTDQCFNKTQITVQLLQSQNDTGHKNQTQECLDESKEVNSKKRQQKPKSTSRCQKGSCIFASAAPTKPANKIGQNGPKVSVNSIVSKPALSKKTKTVCSKQKSRHKHGNFTPKHRCNRKKPTGRKRKCGSESQQCLCNVNILDCLLGDIPANYLKKLKQKQLKGLNETKQDVQTCVLE